MDVQRNELLEYHSLYFCYQYRNSTNKVNTLPADIVPESIEAKKGQHKKEAFIYQD